MFGNLALTNNAFAVELLQLHYHRQVQARLKLNIRTAGRAEKHSSLEPGIVAYYYYYYYYYYLTYDMCPYDTNQPNDAPSARIHVSSPSPAAKQKTCVYECVSVCVRACVKMTMMRLSDVH